MKSWQEQNSVSTSSIYFIFYFVCVCVCFRVANLPSPPPAPCRLLFSPVAEEGCAEFMDVTVLVVGTAAVLALPLLAISLCCKSAPSSSSQCLRGPTPCGSHGNHLKVVYLALGSPHSQGAPLTISLPWYPKYNILSLVPLTPSPDLGTDLSFTHHAMQGCGKDRDVTWMDKAR